MAPSPCRNGETFFIAKHGESIGAPGAGGVARPRAHEDRGPGAGHLATHRAPANATFWALHVAIQNAMGWTDSHLHDFELPNADGGEPTWIGMPGFEGDDWREVHADYDE